MALPEQSKEPRNYLNILEDYELDYFRSLSASELFQLYCTATQLTDEKLAEKLGISDSTLKRFKKHNYEYSRPDPSTLQKICLNLRLSVDEAEIFCNNYSYLFINTHIKADKLFKKKLEGNIYVPMSHKLSKAHRRYLIKLFLKKYDDITQKELAELLCATPRTIIRDFQALNIINLGSKKKPKWEIVE